MLIKGKKTTIKNFFPLPFIGVFIVIFGIISSCDRKETEPEVSTPIGGKDFSHLNGSVIVCGDSKIFMVKYPNDKNDTIPKILWQWDAMYSDYLTSEGDKRKFYSIDDCKGVPEQEKILVSSSSGAIAILTIKDKKIIFLADVPNAHSIELLPNNKVVAAASTNVNGNKIMLFDIGPPAKLLDTDSLYSAHGVVWDNRRNLLYALGYDVLREYKIQDEKKLEKVNEWKIPSESGHDLQFTPDKNGLFYTGYAGAWLFDIDNKKFSKIANFPDAKQIKSLNQNKMGQFVYTIPEESWWTYHVSFFNPQRSLSFPDMKVYKVRLYEK